MGNFGCTFIFGDEVLDFGLAEFYAYIYSYVIKMLKISATYVYCKFCGLELFEAALDICTYGHNCYVHVYIIYNYATDALIFLMVRRMYYGTQAIFFLCT